MWIVYLIQHSVDKGFYIGITSNIKKRLSDHNSNGQYSTKRKQGKWILVYAEAYRSKKDALKREKRLKYHGSALHGLKKRIEHSIIEN